MSDPTVKGTVELRISEDELAAHLVFTPEEGGKEWNLQGLTRLLNEEGVTDGFDQYSLREILNDFAKGEEGSPREVKAAEGIAPKPGKPETVKWEEHPIPEEMEEEGKKVLNEAGLPRITKVITEKVKFTKKVEVKPKLPFLKSKEELVTTVEKRKREVPVKIDPRVEETGWVETGQKIALLSSAEPGEMGKTVRGTPIMPNDSQEPAVYPGRGIEAKRNELIANETGFLRRGKNWVEVISFSRHNWDLETSKDNGTLFFHFTPGHKLSQPPAVEEIIKEAEKTEYPREAMVSEENIASIIEKAIRSDEPAKNVSLSLDRDSKIAISITEDNMKALLNLHKGRGGGVPLSMKQVGGSISASGLKGMDLKKIKEDMVQFYRSKSHDLTDYVLVEGKPPGEPKPAEVKLSVTFMSEEEKNSLSDDEEQAYAGIHSLDEFPPSLVEEICKVERHQEIGEIVEGKRGENGRDVYGKVLEGAAPNEPKVSFFENINNESGKIIAGISGLLEKGRKAEMPTDASPEESDEGTLLLRIRPFEDSAVSVSVSPDKMEASISISPAKGAGEAISLEKAREIIDSRGIKEGIDEELLSRLIEQAARGESIQKIVFARGTPPKHATSNKIELLVTPAEDKKVTIKEDGRADYKNRSSIVSVKKDQPLAKLLPPEQEPSDGRDITGKTVPAKKIQDFQLEVGANIRSEEEETGTVVLYSEISGELFYDRKTISVAGIHTVEGDVDLKTGNIKFSGAVQVKGSVTNGFYVMSTDSVTIKGAVEGALISAEKDIIIGQGIKGLGKAVLRSKQNIGAAFAEQATLLSVANIKLKNSCLRCSVKCNGKLTLESDKGDLIGGKTRVRMGLSVHNIGSSSGAQTAVSFGQDYLIEDQIEKEEKEIEKIKEKLTKFDFFLNTLEKEGKKIQLEKGRREKLKLMKLMEKRGLRLFTLKEKFEEHYPSELEIRGTLFPGVMIESHGRFYDVKEEEKKVTLFFDLETGQIRKKEKEEKS